MATAAALESVDCGPPAVRSSVGLAAAVRSAPVRAGWIRGVNYHESVAGDLDRTAVDRLRADVPVRVQHRSGALWVLNSRAISELRLDASGEPGVERDASGRPTGRLWRLDAWLRERTPRAAPDLAAVSSTLAAFGVTGVTDATPELDAASVATLTGGAIAQRLVLMGDPAGDGPWKIVVADHDLPALDELTERIRAVRPRPVALHAVTRVALVLALAALHDAGTVAGDRIEHAAVVPPELLESLRGTGVTVVTQPSLPARRGDDYLADVDPADRDYLWPFASLLDAGVPVGCSSDAPFGELDPWFSIRAASRRVTRAGRSIASHERVSRDVALHGYLSAPRDPGGPARAVVVGAPADLVVVVAADDERAQVTATIIDGRLVHHV
jgi:predicted amidohydrolase YtcJ